MAKKRTPSKKLHEQRKRQRQKTFLEALEQSGGHIQNACNACRIHRSTIYEWMEEDPNFNEGLNLIRDGKIDNVEAALYKGALEGNTVAQMFYLKTIGRKRGYGERVEYVDVTEVDFSDA